MSPRQGFLSVEVTAFQLFDLNVQLFVVRPSRTPAVTTAPAGTGNRVLWIRRAGDVSLLLLVFQARTCPYRRKRQQLADGRLWRRPQHNGPFFSTHQQV